MFLVDNACFSWYRLFCRSFAFGPFELVEFLWYDVSLTWMIEFRWIIWLCWCLHKMELNFLKFWLMFLGGLRLSVVHSLFIAFLALSGCSIICWIFKRAFGCFWLFEAFVNHVELVWWCAVLGEWQVFSSWSLTIFTCIRCFSWWKSCIFIPILSYSCYCYFAGCARGDAKSPGFNFSWDVDNNSSFWSGSIICWLPSKAVVRDILASLFPSSAG